MWKKHLDPVVRDYLNELLKETLQYREAYLKADDSRIAQLWVALGIIYRELQKIKLEIEDLKKKLNQNNEKKSKNKTLLETLEKL